MLQRLNLNAQNSSVHAPIKKEPAELSPLIAYSPLRKAIALVNSTTTLVCLLGQKFPYSLRVSMYSYSKESYLIL